jgi:flagellar hook protein FlgE
MVRSLNSGVSGIQQFQTKLDVIGNNIANSNTLGFKSGRADFEDTFSQTLTGGVTGIQVGSGVATGSVRQLFQQGVLTRTNVPTDMALDGDGFFVVRDPIADKTFVTRAGAFDRDREGYLVTSQGYRVQGFSDATLTVPGDIRIDDTGKPDGDPGTYKNFSVNAEGIITVHLDVSDTKFTRGQILLQRFQNPNALVKEGNNLFSGMEEAGGLAQMAAPKTNGMGEVVVGHLETSNVDVANEFTNLITTQRGFQASARIITTTDEMLQEVVNLKR